MRSLLSKMAVWNWYGITYSYYVILINVRINAHSRMDYQYAIGNRRERRPRGPVRYLILVGQMSSRRQEARKSGVTYPESTVGKSLICGDPLYHIVRRPARVRTGTEREDAKQR